MKPTLEQVIKVVDYNPETGAMTWRERDATLIPNPNFLRTWNTKHSGTQAARPDGNQMKVRIGKVSYLANRIIYLIQTGEWPVGRLININNDQFDLRWNNICLEKDRPFDVYEVRPAKGNPGVVWCGQEGKYLAFYHIEFIMMIVGLYRSSREAVEARQLALAAIN